MPYDLVSLQQLLQEGGVRASPGCRPLTELLQMRTVSDPSSLPLPGDTQPILNCNFLLLAKKKFQHRVLFISHQTLSIPILPGWDLLSLRIKTPVSCLFRKTLSILHGSPQTHQMLSGKILLFSSSLTQRLTTVAQKAGKVSNIFRRVTSLHSWNLLTSCTRKFFLMSNCTLSCCHWLRTSL